MALAISTVAGNGFGATYLHILHLVSIGVKETVTKDYGFPVLQVAQQSF
jgi:hypothetical protein